MKHFNTLTALWLLNATEYRFRRETLEKLPRVPAIYFACKGARILYVGKTSNLYARWVTREHHQYAPLVSAKADRLIILPMTNHLTHGFETLMIHHLAPTFNGRQEPFGFLGWVVGCLFLALPLVCCSAALFLGFSLGGLV